MGTPTAPAMCIAPESFETTADARERTPASVRRSVSPVRSIIEPWPAPPAARYAARTSPAVSRSPGAPTSTGVTACSRATRAATSPTRSGGHRLAEPNAAPGAKATNGRPSVQPWDVSNSAARAPASASRRKDATSGMEGPPSAVASAR